MTIFFRIKTYSEHGYDFTELRAYEARPVSIADAIEQCVDNKAGYQNLEIAREMQARYENLRDQGYTHMADTCLYEPSCLITWQHYTPARASEDDPQQYCDPRINVGAGGDKLSAINRNLKLVNKLGLRARRYMDHQRYTKGPARDIDLKSPIAMQHALRAMKTAQEVETVQASSHDWRDCWTDEAAEVAA